MRIVLNVCAARADNKDARRRWTVRLVRAVLLAVLFAPAPVAGAGVARDTTGSKALEEARRAQAAFEEVRMRNLPWVRRGPRADCDEIVGRFCFWHDAGSRWRPPTEPPTVTAARERLLETLASTAAAAPASEWIVGQRVRYLVEVDRGEDAIAVATSCAATAWWCAALGGYALHAAGRYAEAEAAFDRVLDNLPPAERPLWNDLALLLTTDVRRIYRSLGESGKRAFARRLWWLADPLWMMRGNERRSEHYARLVIDRILRTARSPFEVRWGADLRELTLRYGWPVGWERIRKSAGTLGGGIRASTVSHDPPGGRQFMPPGLALTAPADVPPEAWRMDGEEPRTTFAPAYADSFIDLVHQLAVFRRGEAAVVVAAYDIAPAYGTSARSPGGSAALVLATDPDAEPIIARTSTDATRGVLRVAVPWAPAVASLEVLSSADRLAARARYGLPIRGGARDRPAVSDLLLVDGGVRVATLEDAVSHARGSLRVVPGEAVGVYFEVYPPPGGPHDVRVTLTLRDESGGFWSGLKAVFGLSADRSGSVAMEWTESIEADTEAYARSIVVALPELPRGLYVLELEVGFEHAEPVVAARTLEVVRR